MDLLPLSREDICIENRQCVDVVSGTALLALAVGLPLRAEEAGWPERGEEVKSMGFHSKYKPYFGAMLKFDRREETTRGGGELLLGVYRDIGNPNMGIGLTGEAYAASVERDMDGGLRGFFSVKTLMLSFGADYSIRDDRIRYLWSIQVPIWRFEKPYHSSAELE